MSLTPAAPAETPPLSAYATAASTPFSQDGEGEGARAAARLTLLRENYRASLPVSYLEEQFTRAARFVAAHGEDVLGAEELGSLRGWQRIAESDVHARDGAPSSPKTPAEAAHAAQSTMAAKALFVQVLTAAAPGWSDYGSGEAGANGTAGGGARGGRAASANPVERGSVTGGVAGPASPASPGMWEWAGMLSAAAIASAGLGSRGGSPESSPASGGEDNPWALEAHAAVLDFAPPEAVVTALRKRPLLREVPRALTARLRTAAATVGSDGVDRWLGLLCELGGAGALIEALEDIMLETDYERGDADVPERIKAGARSKAEAKAKASKGKRGRASEPQQPPSADAVDVIASVRALMNTAVGVAAVTAERAAVPTLTHAFRGGADGDAQMAALELITSMALASAEGFAAVTSNVLSTQCGIGAGGIGLGDALLQRLASFAPCGEKTCCLVLLSACLQPPGAGASPAPRGAAAMIEAAAEAEQGPAPSPDKSAAAPAPVDKGQLQLALAVVERMEGSGMDQIMDMLAAEKDAVLDAVAAKYRSLAAAVRAQVKAMQPKPPPPPPPPPPGGRGKGVPPPPPPPGAKKPKNYGRAPRVKMRTLFWEVVPDKGMAPTSVWAGIEKGKRGTKLEEEDYAALERMFAQEAPRKEGAGGRQRAGSQLRTTVLDMRRATAVGITMSRLACSWQEARAAMYAMDAKVFPSAEEVAAVRKCLPSDDERERLLAAMQTLAPDASFAMDEWGAVPPPPEAAALLFAEADLFAYELLRVPLVRRRLRVHEIVLAAGGRLAELEAVVGAYRLAAGAVKASATLKGALRLLLAAGNFMNHGNPRLGAARGVRPLALAKLRDVRANRKEGTSAAAPRESLLVWATQRMDSPEAMEDELAAVGSDHLKMDLREVDALCEGLGANLGEAVAELSAVPPAVRAELAVAESEDGDESKARVRLALRADRLVEELEPQLGLLVERHALLRATLKPLRASIAAAMAFMGERSDAPGAEVTFFCAMSEFVTAFRGACELSEADTKRRRQQAEREARKKRERIVHDGKGYD